MKKILKRCEEAINKLTYKQCKKIITIVVISAAILMLGIVIFLCSYNKQPITNWLLSLLTGVIGIPLMVGALTWILLATEWKQQEENEIKVRPEVRKRFKLSQTEFVEVEPKEATEPFEIIKSLGGKYFAKENEERDGIIVIIKDARHNKELKETRRDVSYTWFNEHYKLKD